jgi:hypothetical protein
MRLAAAPLQIQSASARAPRPISSRFAAIFRRAERFLNQLESGQPTPERRQSELALLQELGREALMENADWVLLLRERPIALPKG